jgi:hypothetical protein
VDNPASVSDARLTPYASDPALEATLDAAWRALQREPELRGMIGWISTGQLTSEDAADVVVSATLRVMRNPVGAEEESTSIDDYTERTKRADATEDIYFTAAEKRRLTAGLPSVGNAGSFSFTGFGRC